MKINKKFAVKSMSLFLSMAMLAGCGGGGGEDVSLDESGNVRPSGTVTEITFWGNGDEVEHEVFTNLVNEFNKINKDTIFVKYIKKSPDGYGDNIKLALGGSKGPDVFYVGDSDYKVLADYGYLLELDDYMATSKEIVKEEMWETSIDRYRYDVDTTTQDGPNAKYWGIPKDIGPTAIFYNETYFKDAGITTISVASEDLNAFNNENAKDSRGKTKDSYGISGEVKEKGYFTDGSKKFFNNQIPMSWQETRDLSVLVANGSEAEYGYFTEWWFNYGWSVGGDCIQYISTEDSAYNGGYWDFTLLDATANYIVADDVTDAVVVNGKSYNAGEIISYQDKIKDLVNDKTVKNEVVALANNGKLNVLPSQREAFIEFIRLGQDKDVTVDTVNGEDLKGYEVIPSPTSIGGDLGKKTAFAQGKVAMLVDGRWNVTNFRKEMDGIYDWDVAPLPMYKEYDSNGDVLVHGVEAGHSGSMALSINKKSKYKNASWKFIEYIGGRTGQTEQAKSGFAIPSQKDVANSEVFLQTDQNPRNSIVFVKAAEHQTPGDWWYLLDNRWIDSWAGILNGDVRNGKMTLTQFENHNSYTKTYATLKNYTKK